MKNYIGISRDHSASMRGLEAAASSDYNDNIASIKEGSAEHNIDTIVSVVKCGVGRAATVEREVVNSNVIALNPIKAGQYVADGNATPLFDSVGDLIEQLESVPDANDLDVSFIVMVITDGGENSSRKWTGSSIAKKIAELRKTDRWTFSFRVPRGYKRELAQYGIRVNTIVPGQLHTPMVEVRLAGQRTGGDVEALLAQRQARIPLPFMGDGRDTANAALYLASDESRFVTGTEIVVDGGMSVRCG